jgi:hypothetical protein
MPILTNDDRQMFSLCLAGRYDLFTQYYFNGWKPLANQYAEHYAPQPNVTLLGGVGSGKTAGKGKSFMAKAMTQPYYLGLNTSISAFQSKLMYEQLVPLIENSDLVKRFIADVKSRPYPLIETIFGSKIAFMTAGVEAQLIRGSEWDEINGDEFGYEKSEATIHALRGRLRGTRPNGIPRLARLTITTTPTEVPWLRQRFDAGWKGSGHPDYNRRRYLSLRSTLFDNTYIPAWQREEIMAGYTEEMIQQEIMAEFPDWGNTEFASRFIDGCENALMNDLMERLTNPIYEDENGNEHCGTPVPGAAVVEMPRFGVTLWEMPYETGHVYVETGDPGTDSPPKRNAGVVMVWDVTTKPYQLVYFHWVSGNGSYQPWLSSFKYALAKYRPLYKGIDATGTQKAIDELVFEREGIPMDSVNFAHDKKGMLNALKLLMQNYELRFPVIRGMHNQLLGYRLPDDDIAQDIVSCMMVFAALERFLPDSLSVQKTTRVKTHAQRAREDRSRRNTYGGRRAPR